MKQIRAMACALISFAAVTVCTLASQDIIVLDPGNSKIVYYAKGTSVRLPGLPGVIRDDLLSLPDARERMLCYEHPSGPLKVDRIRYIVRQGSSTRRFVEIIDDPVGGAYTGVSVRLQGVEITNTCMHSGIGSNACWNTGIPDEMFGDLEVGSMYYLVGNSWEAGAPNKKFQIQIPAAGAATCSTF